MFFGPLESLAWTPVRRWRPEEAGVERDAAAVLAATGSLTRFLERHYGMHLEVRLHDQFVDDAAGAEAALLGCVAGSPALRRRVSLMFRGSVMFDAESVLPLDGVHGELMQELQEGEKPLGNLLLDRGLSLSRSDLSVARLPEDAKAPWAGCWARRSVLRSASGTRALVVEVFHDAMWQRVARMGRRYR